MSVVREREYIPDPANLASRKPIVSSGKGELGHPAWIAWLSPKWRPAARFRFASGRDFSQLSADRPKTLKEKGFAAAQILSLVTSRTLASRRPAFVSPTTGSSTELIPDLSGGKQINLWQLAPEGEIKTWGAMVAWLGQRLASFRFDLFLDVFPDKPIDLTQAQVPAQLREEIAQAEAVLQKPTRVSFSFRNRPLEQPKGLTPLPPKLELYFFPFNLQDRAGPFLEAQQAQANRVLAAITQAITESGQVTNAALLAHFITPPPSLESEPLAAFADFYHQ